MNCPKCNNKAISFFNWAKGQRWYKTKCDSCGTPLKGNSITQIGFIVSVLVAAGLGLALRNILHQTHTTSIMAGIVTVCIAAVFTFKIGGYDAD